MDVPWSSSLKTYTTDAGPSTRNIQSETLRSFERMLSRQLRAFDSKLVKAVAASGLYSNRHAKHVGLHFADSTSMQGNELVPCAYLPMTATEETAHDDCLVGCCRNAQQSTKLQCSLLLEITCNPTVMYKYRQENAQCNRHVPFIWKPRQVMVV